MGLETPKYQDEVKHKRNDTAGTVIANYFLDKEEYFDVRGTDGKIYYFTKAENWVVVNKAEDST